MKTDITVIIPVHTINEQTKQLLNNAVKSVIEQKSLPDEVLFIIPADAPEVDVAVKESFDLALQSLSVGLQLNYRVLYNQGKTDFSSQINLGVENVNTKFFSFLEFDDEYSKIWFKNAVEYIQAYPDVDVFLPLIVDTAPNGSFLSFTNEAVWANQFSDELGYLDLQALLTYQNFNIDGMVINTETYKTNGGLKTNIKLTFIYELLLRLVNNGVKVMTLPKLGYKHMNQREDSLFLSYTTMTQDETKFWLAQAKKEYYFDYEREITYEK
jgi:hypothetical protein